MWSVAAHVAIMNGDVVYGVLDRRAVLRNAAGRIMVRPSPSLARIPVLRAYPSVVAARAAQRELNLDLQILALCGSFPTGSLFSVGARIGRGFHSLGLFDDLGQALITASDRELFPTSQGAIDLLSAAPVFTSAAQFRTSGRPGIPLLDWQGLNSEFFVLEEPDTEETQPAASRGFPGRGVPTGHTEVGTFALA